MVVRLLNLGEPNEAYDLHGGNTSLRRFAVKLLSQVRRDDLLRV